MPGYSIIDQMIEKQINQSQEIKNYNAARLCGTEHSDIFIPIVTELIDKEVKDIKKTLLFTL